NEGRSDFAGVAVPGNDEHSASGPSCASSTDVEPSRLVDCSQRYVSRGGRQMRGTGIRPTRHPRGSQGQSRSADRLRLLAIPVLALLFTAIPACSSTATEDPSERDKQGEDVGSGDAQDRAGPAESAPMSEGGATTATRGCAHVVYCDKPNDAIGAVCHQDVCSLYDAELECRSDLRSLGCELHCPAIIQAPGGNKRLCACCAYCGPTGACCDGVHFSQACPP